MLGVPQGEALGMPQLKYDGGMMPLLEGQATFSKTETLCEKDGAGKDLWI